MSSTTFNIGLSFLSSKEDHKTEARRILSQFEGRIIAESDILREESGRPFFRGHAHQRCGTRDTHTKGVGQGDFNISHSGDMVAVSYVRGSNLTSLRTGCDIQLVKERTNTLKIAEQFFSPAEVNYIFSQKEKGNDSAFFEIWALKECYIKLCGLSVFDMASAPSFIGGDGELELAAGDVLFYLYKLNDDAGRQYVLAAAIKGEAITPSMQWFSESSLPCERIDKICINVNNAI